MAGLLETAKKQSTNLADPAAPGVAASGYDPERLKIDESKETVEGRVNNLLSSENTLMQSARTKAAQNSAKRGLLNSTLGVSAGEQAVIETALPIAQQDAQTFYDANKTNVTNANKAYEFTAGNEQQLKLQGAQTAGQQQLQENQGDIQSRIQQERHEQVLKEAQNEGTIRAGLMQTQGDVDIRTAQAQGDINSTLQAERGEIERMLVAAEGAQREALMVRQGEIDAQLQELRTQGALQLADVEGQWRSLMQASQSAALFFSQTAEAIGGILANPDIPANQKQGLIDKQRNLLEDGLEVIGATANLDLGSILKFGAGGEPATTPGVPENYQDLLDQLRRGGFVGSVGNG